MLGLVIGWVLWRPAAPIAEPPAVAVRQGDSSLVLARRPDTTVKIPHVIPAGTRPVREISVAVQPAAPLIVHDTVPVPGEPGRLIVKVDTVFCPAVVVNLTEVENTADHTRRLVASSPDGRVIAERSIDVPLAPARAPPRQLPWSAGALRVQDNGWGGYLSRDLGPFRLLAGGLQGLPGGRAVILLGAGLRF